MRSAIVSYLLVLPMLMHGLFGCCWHHEQCHHQAERNAEQGEALSQTHCCHEHDEESAHECCEIGDVAVNEVANLGHSDGAEALTGHSSPQRHIPHGCTGTRCQYLGSSRVRANDPATVATGLALLFAADMTPLRLSDSLVVAVRQNPARDAGMGHLRAHALCCVWLI